MTLERSPRGRNPQDEGFAVFDPLCGDPDSIIANERQSHGWPPAWLDLLVASRRPHFYRRRY